MRIGNKEKDMSVLANQDMYKEEIKFVKKYDELAMCTLDQLSKQNQLKFKELHKIVDTCLDEKITKKSFEQCVRGMLLKGLVIETFSKDQQFKIELSSIGKVVHKTIKKDSKHLATI